MGLKKLGVRSAKPTKISNKPRINNSIENHFNEIINLSG